MGFTLEDLRDLVERTELLPPETPVRLAHQPHWPFEYDIDETAIVDVKNDRTGETQQVIYLGEGNQIGYLPSEAKEELMW